MKIVYVITRMVRGGSSKMALETARRIRARGHDVVFATGRDDTGHNSFWKELLASNLDVRTLGWMTRSPGLHDLPALFELIKLFRATEPDCVHLHTSKAGTLGAIAARLSGVGGIVYSSHGHLFHPDLELQDVHVEGLSRWFYYWLRRLTIALSDRVVALSEQDLQEQLELKLGREDKYVVIPNGIDLDRYRKIEWDAVPETNNKYPVLLTVGRLVKEKGQDTLIEAVDELRKTYPELSCLIVGEGPYRTELESMVHERNLEQYVSLPGSVSDVVPYYRSADVFCFPSLYESQGVAVMEAMAAGLPVVSTEKGGLSELVDPGETALVVKPKDPGGLVRGVKRILDDDELRQRLVESAGSRVADKYSLDTLARRTLSLYETVLEDSP